MDDKTIPSPVEAMVQDPDPTNLLEQLAAKRKEISDTKETFIPIPGYDRNPPLLLARYRLLEGPELSRIIDKVRRDVKGRWDRQVYAAVDTFIAACVGMYVDTGDGKPVPMILNGSPILGFNEDLATALQYRDELPEPATHRSVVFGLFANNDVAISQHSFNLNRWMGDTTIDVSEDLLGGNS